MIPDALPRRAIIDLAHEFASRPPILGKGRKKMAFYTRVNPTEVKKVGEVTAEAYAGKPPTDNPCTLRIFVDQNTGDYSYQFTKRSFILWNATDTITFHIRNEIPNTTASILSHLSTDHADSTGKPKVILVDHTMGDAEIKDPAGHYNTKRPVKTRYRLDIKPFELVHIGLIVEVKPTDTQLESSFLLCDPQVGNGPP